MPKKLVKQGGNKYFYPLTKTEKSNVDNLGDD